MGAKNSAEAKRHLSEIRQVTYAFGKRKPHNRKNAVGWTETNFGFESCSWN